MNKIMSESFRIGFMRGFLAAGETIVRSQPTYRLNASPTLALAWRRVGVALNDATAIEAGRIGTDTQKERKQAAH